MPSRSVSLLAARRVKVEMMGACAKPRLRSPSGVAALELILALPVVLILFIATFEFAMAVIFQSAVAHAATVGAREAGKEPDIGIVVAAVQDVVEANCIQISGALGSGTKVILEDGDGPDSEFGDASLACQPPTNALYPGEVRVTVCVDILATPFCHALKDWGVSFQGTTFRASSLVKKEYEQDLLP